MSEVYRMPNAENLRILENPIYIWEYSFHGLWSEGIIVQHTKSYPNWFIRFMWKWVLGIHTRRIKKVSDE